MTTNSPLSRSEPKNTHTKKQNQLSKQLEQEQIHRNRDYMVGCQQGGEVGRMKEKAQGIRSINCKYKIGRGRLRIVPEI